MGWHFKPTLLKGNHLSPAVARTAQVAAEYSAYMIISALLLCFKQHQAAGAAVLLKEYQRKNPHSLRVPVHTWSKI